MEDGNASRTALMVANMRAHHYLTAAEPKILNDNVALSLSGLETRENVEKYYDSVLGGFTALSDELTARTFMRRLSDSVCMRSRLVEEALMISRDRGMKQLVILGAGLDTTAYRNLELTQGMDIFEVDHPATQAWKRERLVQSGIQTPDNLNFVSFDFENQTLGQALEKGGVRFDKMTFFSWLGVHMYLTDETVRSTLSVLGSFPKGSELVMDFVSPDYSHNPDLEPDSLDQLAEVVAKMGEPFLSLYREDELEQRLREAGFDSVKYFAAHMLVDEFLDGNKEAYSLPDSAVSMLAAKILP